MITIKDFMEAVNYRITEGSEFRWRCFGPTAYRLDSWNGEQDGYTISIVFDTQTQEVYEAEAWDYARNKVYRLQNPDYIDAYIAEAKERNIDPTEALEGDEIGGPTKYIDLEVDGDFLEKAMAIVQGIEYDNRVQLPITLPDDALFRLMQLAHEQDLTFNQFMEKMLREEIDRSKSMTEHSPIIEAKSTKPKKHKGKTKKEGKM